jgi:uncharacterized delta-60 repeat protein
MRTHGRPVPALIGIVAVSLALSIGNAVATTRAVSLVVRSEAGVPVAPTNLIADSVTATSARISWAAPAGAGSSDITGYEVAWAASAVSTPGTSVVLAGLLPDTRYDVMVRARNSEGLSNGTLVAVVTSPSPHAPGPPRDLKATGPTPRSVALDWSSPADDGGLPLTGYLVQWPGQEVVVTDSSTQVTGLTPGTGYRFTVRALNDAGRSDPVALSVVTAAEPATDLAVPTPPRDVRITAATRSTMAIGWSAPASSGASAITGYLVEWGPGTSIVVTETKAEIVGLTAGTNVTVSVFALNDAGPSSATRVAGYTAMAPVIGPLTPDPVQDLRVIFRGSSTIKLEWEAPASDGGEPILFYEVREDDTIVMQTTDTATFAIVKQLEPGTFHTFAVHARNSVGLSEPVVVTAWTSMVPIDPPTAPGAPRGLAVASRDRTTMTMRWQPPESDGGSDLVGYTASWYRISSVANEPGKRDYSFSIGPGPSNPGGPDGVTSVVVQPDGKILVGGFFDTWGGRVVGGIVRLNRDGSRDAGFDAGWGTDGGSVQSIVLQPDGKILVGGFIYRFNGVPAHGIVRLNPDGSVDQAFQQGAGFNDAVVQLALQPDGKIVAIGSFWLYDGQDAVGIARLHPDGRLDTSFASGLDLSARLLDSLLVLPDGSIVLGGIPNGMYGPLAWGDVRVPGLLRVDSQGNLDMSFHEAIGSGIGWESSSDVAISITRQPDGRLLVGGGFPAFDGEQRWANLVRLMPDGQVDPTFRGGEPGTDRQVNDVVHQPDGRMILLGNFSRYGDAAADGAVRVGSDGIRDATFDAGSGFVGSVFTGALASDSTVIIGGFVDQFNGLPINRLVRLYAGSSVPPGQEAVPVQASAGEASTFIDEPWVFIDGLEAGELYRVEVRALNVMGESEPNTGDVRTSMDPAPTPSVPSAPQNLVVTGATSTSITLDWQTPRRDGGSPVLGYLVQRSGGGQVSAGGTAAVVSDLAPGTEYQITVRARNQMGAGVSASVTARTSAGPPPGPGPTPQPISPPVAVASAPLAADRDGDAVTVRQTVRGAWPPVSVIVAGVTTVISARDGSMTNAGQQARPRATYRSPSIRSVRITRDASTGAYRIQAVLKSGKRSGAVIVTMEAPATAVAGISYEPLQASRRFTVRRGHR